MPVYLDIVIVLNFFVDLLLLIGTNKLCGYPCGMIRVILGALLGGAYAGACLLPGFSFLGNTLWRVVFLGLMGWVAFGTGKSMLMRLPVYVLLSLALGGAVAAVQAGGLGALGVTLLGLAALRILRPGRRPKLIPLKLFLDGRSLSVMALEDTGNTLRDPITGRSVIVLGAQEACRLTGLELEQLKDPVGTMGAIPGLCLIPYRTVGNPGGLLLGKRIAVGQGNKRRKELVAFAPDTLAARGNYQALCGIQEEWNEEKIARVMDQVEGHRLHGALLHRRSGCASTAPEGRTGTGCAYGAGGRR